MAFYTVRHLRGLLLSTCVLLLFVVFSPRGHGEQTPKSSIQKQIEAVGEDFKIKVTVEEVRIDATVVDKKGRQITDLTEDDFEISQDGKKQDILAVKYISYDHAGTEKTGIADRDHSTLPRGSPPLLEPGSIQRSIIFLINDAGMSYEEIYRTRISLEKYVKDQMMPGDLVSLIKTSRGSANLQAFTTDKSELLSRIETIQWSNASPQLMEKEYSSMLTDASMPSGTAAHISRLLTITRKSIQDSQTSSIHYCLMALQNMPGRKFLMLVTPNNDGGSTFDPAYMRMADAALRAGVIVHTFDIRGVRTTRIISYRSGSQDDSGRFASDFDAMPIYINSFQLPLSKKTGGLNLNNNFFINGIGDAEEHMKGYYLISYTPPENTFSKSGLNSYHRIEVKVKRKGAQVHTRDGFYGAHATLASAELPPSPLTEAMFSPFQHNDLNISLTSGYVDDPRGGYLLPTWMHMGGKNLEIVEDDGGERYVSFKIAATTTDNDGIITDYGEMQASMLLNEEDIPRLRENGINFSVSIPVKKAGGYYVRIAAMDRSSGLMGSAYQFTDIPDLADKKLALSSLYITGREEDADWLQASVTGDPEKSPASHTPKIAGRNPAYKDFVHGDSFKYMGVIYNAKNVKKGLPSLEFRFVLFRDGKEIYKSEPEIIDVEGVSDIKRIPFRRIMEIKRSMKPGDYILQVFITDKRAKKNQQLAVQALNFRVLEP